MEQELAIKLSCTRIVCLGSRERIFAFAWSSIIHSLSEIDIVEDYSSRSTVNLVQDSIRANAIFPEALKASLEPQTQVRIRRELLDPLLDSLPDVARELLEPFQKGV